MPSGGLTGVLTPGFIPVADTPSGLVDSVIAQVPGATQGNVSINGGLAADFAGLDGCLHIEESPNFLTALPASGTLLFHDLVNFAFNIAVANGNVFQFASDALYIYDNGLVPLLFATWSINGAPDNEIKIGGSDCKFVRLDNAQNNLYWDAGVGWDNAPQGILYPDTPGVCDIGGSIGGSDFYWRHIFIVGQIWQDGIDGAGVGAGTLANAPHAGPADAWVPYTFNDIPGWIPWWHA